MWRLWDCCLLSMACSVSSLCFVQKQGLFYVALALLELTMWTRLASNSWKSYLAS